ncbi:MAG: nucleotidyltransferase, partial [Deltaproteobacteria bacterium]|nr:nucleotidyltransferase [Deltaproteobacteria bacterium]
MRAVGLVTEYNPFHNGHHYHLQESLKITGAEASVAIMSGHFLQRGEPALLDKWSRTDMALAGGVDLVLELPFPFACNSAPHFAKAAIQALDGLGVVDALCFGSEVGTIEPLQTVAECLINQDERIMSATKRRLRDGLSFPAARAEILAQQLPGISATMIASPNNILGVEYLRALHLLRSPMRAFTVQRTGAHYHSSEVSGQIASATGIRRRLACGEPVDALMPAASWPILQEALQGERYLDQIRFFDALLVLLLQERDTLKTIYQVCDGLDKRLTQAALVAKDYRDLVALIKSRHWTATRIQRILCYVLTQLSRREMAGYLSEGPLYLHVLGATKTGEALLARSRKRRVLPVFADPARARPALRRSYRNSPERCRVAEQMLACDLRATRLFGLVMK